MFAERIWFFVWDELHVQDRLGLTPKNLTPTEVAKPENIIELVFPGTKIPTDTGTDCIEEDSDYVKDDEVSAHIRLSRLSPRGNFVPKNKVVSCNSRRLSS